MRMYAWSLPPRNFCPSSDPWLLAIALGQLSHAALRPGDLSSAADLASHGASDAAGADWASAVFVLTHPNCLNLSINQSGHGTSTYHKLSYDSVSPLSFGLTCRRT